MEKILISACLIGERTRYDGMVIPQKSPILLKLMDEGRLISFCPEVSGGMETPRPPAEIINGSGNSVISGRSKIINKNERDVTEFFIRGAKNALAVSIKNDIKIAILKDGSPSCGSSYIYDGSFSGKKITGLGVTAEYLTQNGILVYNEHEIHLLELGI